MLWTCLVWMFAIPCVPESIQGQYAVKNMRPSCYEPTPQIIHSDILPLYTRKKRVRLTFKELDAGDCLGACKSLIRLLLAREPRIIHVVDVKADIIPYPVQPSSQEILVTEGNGVALPLMPDGKGVEKLAFRLIRVQLNNVSFARR